MASDIVPASESFTTSNMKPAVDEAATANWAQAIAANTGFNKLQTNKPLWAWGTKALTFDDSIPANTTTLDFGTDKVDGTTDFSSGTSYGIFFTITTISGTVAIENIKIRVPTRNAGDCVVEIDGNLGMGNGTVNVMWIAIGY